MNRFDWQDAVVLVSALFALASHLLFRSLHWI
jgi:hypothetical protein